MTKEGKEEATGLAARGCASSWWVGASKVVKRTRTKRHWALSHHQKLTGNIAIASNYHKV